MPGRHEKNPKTGKAYNSDTPPLQPKPKIWPKGKKLTPSDTDNPVFTSNTIKNRNW